MAKQIKSSDIFEKEDIFEGVRLSAENTIKTLTKVNNEFSKTASILKKSLGSVKFDSTKAINEFLKAIEKANKLKEQSIKIDQMTAKAQAQANIAVREGAKAQEAQNKANQQAQKVEQEKQKTQRETIKTQREQAKEAERLAKADEKNAKLARDASSAYKQLERNTRELKNQSKELGAQMLKLESDGRKNSAEYRKLAETYQQVTQKAQQGDAQLKKLDKTVGDNFRNVGNYRDALGSLQNVMGQLGLAFGIGSIVQSATKSIIGFEQANATLSAVLGKSRAETQDLQNVQRELGRTSGYTASQVGELQIELARLGFTENEIKGATESVLMLAKASGSDLGRASEVAGATLRGFGLQASEMQRVVDVMAKSFDMSALGMENFAESMKYVAPVAKSAGVSVEQTTAMLGALSNAGISGSQAGTSLRRILTDMATTGKPAKEALQELANKGITLSDAMDEVGRNAQTALLVLTENMDSVNGMTTAFENADGAVYKTAGTMGDTLQGSINRLSGAWEAWILDLNEGTGASETFRDVIDFLTDNLADILDTVLMLIDVWVKYKTITLAQIAINKLMASSFVQTITNAKNLGSVMQGVGGLIQKVGTAIKNNLAGIALFVIGNVIMKYKELNDIYNQGAENAEELANAQKDVEANLKKETIEAKALFDALKQTNNGSKERSALITEINSKYGTTLTNLSNEKDFVKQVNQAYEDLMETLGKKAKMEGTRIKFEVSQRQLAEAEMAFQKASDNLDEYRANTSAGGKVVDALLTHFGVEDENDLIDLYNAYSHALSQARTEAQKYEQDYIDMQAQIATSSAGTGQQVVQTQTNVTTSTHTATKSISEFSYELNKANDYLDRHIELMQLVVEQQQEADFAKGLLNVDALINSAQAKAKNLAIEGKDPLPNIAMQNPDNLPLDQVGFGDMYDEVEKEIIALYDLQASYIKQRYDFQISEIDRLNEYEKQQAIQTLNDEYQQQVDKYNKDKKDIEAKIRAGTESTQSLTNLNNAKLKLDQDYQKATDKLTQDNLERDADALKEKELLTGNYNKDILQNEKDKNTKINEYNDTLNASIEEGAKQHAENMAEISEQEIQAEKDKLAKKKLLWENMNEVVKFSADYFITQSERRIDQLDKEQTKAEETYDMLKQLAINGNIDAQQSLAEQQRIIDEAQVKKEKELKRQQRIKLAETAFNTYNSKVQNLKEGEKSSKALTETIRDMTLLQAFIASLPGFEKGTEDTGTNGRGVDGKGGFHAVLHPNERVVPKDLNAKIGSLTNEELARVANEYQNGRLMRGKDTAGSALDLALLVNKIDELKEVVKNKPETHYGIGEVTQTMVEIVEKTRKGNTTTYNRFKVNK